MRSVSCAALVSLVALATSACTGAADPNPGAGVTPSLGGGGALPPGGATAGSGAEVAAGGGSGVVSSGGAGTDPGAVTTACAPLDPLTRRLWRLSVEQYQSAVTDLLGLSKGPQLTNRGGEAQWAFFSDATLGVDDSFQYALYQAVEALLPTLPASVTACTTGEAPAACATRIAQTFGAKAFRRPLTQIEINALVSNPAQAATATTPAVSAAPFLQAGTDTQTGLKSMIEAILLSPSFLYRTELGPNTLAADASGKYPTTSLTSYEVATQLAFTFLGSTPDAALQAAAADPSANGLGSITGVKAQIDRLLTLPVVKANLTSIIAGWFNVGQLFLKTHDTSFLSALPAADQNDQSGVQSDLFVSTQQFINDVLFVNNGKITDLLTSQKVFLNSRLAPLYPGVTFAAGAPTSATTFVAGTWPAEQARIGLLSYPSYFWAQSDPSANSIVKRGKAIHDDVICADALPPPVDLGSPLALEVISKGDSEVTHSDARLSTSPCNACHIQMDPYSRMLQNFGPIGNYRTVDEAGRAIDTKITFQAPSPLAPQTIAGPKAFADGLVASGHISGCAVQKMASYLIGSLIPKYDTCEINTIRTQFAQSDGSIGSLFRDVVLADFVRTRTGGSK